MEIVVSSAGVRIALSDRVTLGPAAPSVVLDGPPAAWAPSVFTTDASTLAATSGPAGLWVRTQVRQVGDAHVEVRTRIGNSSASPIAVGRLAVLQGRGLRVGDQPRRWRVYRNGYQSWAGTHTLAPDESDIDFSSHWLRLGMTDAKHRAPSAPGHVRSDALTAICDSLSGDALAIGFSTLADAYAFVEIESADGANARWSCWVDLDGLVLAPGAETAEFVVHFVAVSGTPSAGWQALRTLALLIGAEMNARGTTRPHPGGWCSWYYYFTKVTERDVLDNLEVIAADGRNGREFGCEYLMVDDGHQSAIGDWLLTDTKKFPSGMAAVAKRIRDAGFDAGIWWAPFLVSANSNLARQHPEWLVRNHAGQRIVACINPGWGLTQRMWALDTTHPGALAYLEDVARTIGEGWGYAIQKLDFLYAASLPGKRFDRNATRAQSLRRGLEAIRRGAGESAFLLGCGCPLGPAVGIVDAMRIGADVTPYWTDWLAQRVLLDTHGLATRHAIQNTLARAPLDGAWWLNDPDCLMVRDTDTKLSLEEVRTLATVFGLTDGMVVLSDRLDKLPPARRAMVAQTRELAGGDVEVADLFENRTVELVVSRKADRLHLAVLNLTDGPKRMSVPLARLGIKQADSELAEFWTGVPIGIRRDVVDFGELPPHASRVVTIPIRVA